MRMRIFVFLLAGSLLFGVSLHAVQYEYDLGLSTPDIFFSSSRLIVGQKVRLYASVHNRGSKDISAYVSFYQGSILIGDSQPISVRAGGLSDEVFVDFTVPAGSFNIRAEIKGQTPRDDNSSNDVALTALFTPESDSDGDGRIDTEDNCPSVSNPDQKDTDGDGIGDTCDGDDDNDGLSDEEELKRGTNPLKSDTDGDGVSDKEDAFPLDPLRTKKPAKEPEAPSKKPLVEKPPASTPTPASTDEGGPLLSLEIQEQVIQKQPEMGGEQEKILEIPPVRGSEAPSSFFSFQRWSVKILFFLLLVVLVASLVLYFWLGVKEKQKRL